MRVAKADLVPTDHNLRQEYENFEQLERACEEFMAELNTRPHALLKPGLRGRRPGGGDEQRRRRGLGDVDQVPVDELHLRRWLGGGRQ